MPFTVITLKNVPNSLRGDLTRWMQEIATGVYIGNYNSRVREYLWKRVTDTVGRGEATLSYSCRNEVGYTFCTYNTERHMIDSDGIPLVLIPAKDIPSDNLEKRSRGFSNASKYHQANRRVRKETASDRKNKPDDTVTATLLPDADKQVEHELVFLDIETTGLNVESDQIIEIGALKVSAGKEIEFHRFIQIGTHVPDEISSMTGITDDMLRQGSSLEKSIVDLGTFIQGSVLVGYNISFDLRFLNRAFENYSLETIHNRILELMQEAKRRNSFQGNYKFETTLKEYGIDQRGNHRALEDAKLMYELYKRMGLRDQ